MDFEIEEVTEPTPERSEGEIDLAGMREPDADATGFKVFVVEAARDPVTRRAVVLSSVGGLLALLAVGLWRNDVSLSDIALMAASGTSGYLVRPRRPRSPDTG